MEKESIVIFVFLSVLVLAFLVLIVSIVIAVARVTRVTTPIQTVVRTVKNKTRPIGGSKLHGAAKKAAKQVALQTTKVTQNLRHAIRSDLRMLRSSIRKITPKSEQKTLSSTRLRGLVTRGLSLLSGDPCAKFEQLWADHINLTFYYGMLALSSLDPLSEQQKAKIDWTAGKLLQIQEDFATLMSSCVSDDAQKALLIQLFKDHILIVAQMAVAWRAQNANGVRKPSSGFDSSLVQSWYKNANDTISLLESKTGHTSDALHSEYISHLNVTAQYLAAISQIHGSAGSSVVLPSEEATRLFVDALDHIPMLAATFCAQMQACKM